MTCLRSGRPASGCSTFGKSDFIRLPWPAARITTESGATDSVATRAAAAVSARRGESFFAIGRASVGPDSGYIALGAGSRLAFELLQLLTHVDAHRHLGM